MASPLGLTFDSSPNSTKIGTYNVVDSKAVKSLFNGSQFSPFPSSVDIQSGNVTKIRNASEVHGDDIYDTSISSLIKYTNQDKKMAAMKLTAADFAYLKNVGVYPNNRLIIARRFPSGVSNDLTSLQSIEPMSTLISWVKDGDDFISVKYNEEWEDAPATFEDVLNNIGKEVKLSAQQGTKYGSAAAGAIELIPLPGLMEGIQYQVMQNMGLTDAGIGNSPLGNPNLIREATMRKVLDKNKAGSGLTAKFSVTMAVEYEQKFINGVDPTLVYMDIIQNALTFGTSDASFQFNSAFATGTKSIIADLISGDINAIANALAKFVTSLLDAISNIGEKIINALVKGSDSESGSGKKPDIYSAVKSAFASTVGHVISKFKVKLIGIANALTGSPSAPWHVTIGNPKKPLFCSGDMLCKGVTLTLGKNLAFNDLPSYIKIEFTLESARNLGAQEIFNRFNTGKGRSYVRSQQSFVEKPDITFATASETTVTVGTQSVVKNQVTPISSPQTVDTYRVDFSQNSGTPYISYNTGVSTTPTTGDNTTAQINTGSSISTQASNQSQSSQDAKVPVAASSPTPQVDPATVPLSDSQISNSSDSALVNRKDDIDNELLTTPGTITDDNGKITINSKYISLIEEKNKINSEQEDRTFLGSPSNQNNNIA